jgi:DNA invertase Pin-like site-specific DNA recombinase
MTRTEKVAFYIRVSTKEQKDSEAGTDLDRAALKKLLARAERCSFDVMSVYTLDRLYRLKNEGEEE